VREVLFIRAADHLALATNVTSHLAGEKRPAEELAAGTSAIVSGPTTMNADAHIAEPAFGQSCSQIKHDCAGCCPDCEEN
jgi:hypothetical protein